MQVDDKVPIYPDLAGKVAVVTGGSGGIGAATCRLLAANGARVAVNGRDRARVQAMVDAIREGGGQAIGVDGDCTDPADVQRLHHVVEQELGPTEVLAAFVGGGRARPGPVAEVPEEDWQSTLDGSLTATFLTLKSFLPGMVERGRGAIITMASSAARLPGLGAPAPYMAAKAGVVALTRQVASEAGPHGVRANCLAPHTILTEQIKRVAPQEWREQMAAAVPLRRLGTPEDVALAAVFLASDSAAWLTGVTLDVAGGYVMS
ncbi:MAG TPA: SDR family NAD(P)-dependent oxidoreductase [Actinomycetes bacterium]|nr:SDR family NAD(P)-dependent oxidoreductase [Actinomycetes bacterium]